MQEKIQILSQATTSDTSSIKTRDQELHLTPCQILLFQSPTVP